MTGLLTFQYSSVHGSLAAAYTSGALAAEFGPEHVRVSPFADPACGHSEPCGDPLIVEMPLQDALAQRSSVRLLGVVSDGDGPAWALTTTPANLDRRSALLVRALSAVLQARPHRRPTLPSAAGDTWQADGPLRAATILLMEDFVNSKLSLAA